MWKCKKCKKIFSFPIVRKPDAEFTYPTGILGMRTIEPVKFCPHCESTKIFLENEFSSSFCENKLFQERR